MEDVSKINCLTADMFADPDQKQNLVTQSHSSAGDEILKAVKHSTKLHLGN